MNKKFYLTTAIAYTSSKPHIGNVYEAILADAIVRYKKKCGFDTYFQVSLQNNLPISTPTRNRAARGKHEYGVMGWVGEEGF